MTNQALRAALIEALKSVAPESDPASLGDKERVRDALDLDSMDFLNFIIAIHRDLHVEIPEGDYSKMQTLGGAVEYLQTKLPTA